MYKQAIVGLENTTQDEYTKIIFFFKVQLTYVGFAFMHF